MSPVVRYRPTGPRRYQSNPKAGQHRRGGVSNVVAAQQLPLACGRRTHASGGPAPHELPAPGALAATPPVRLSVRPPRRRCDRAPSWLVPRAPRADRRCAELSSRSHRQCCRYERASSRPSEPPRRSVCPRHEKLTPDPCRQPSGTPPRADCTGANGLHEHRKRTAVTTTVGIRTPTTMCSAAIVGRSVRNRADRRPIGRPGGVVPTGVSPDQCPREQTCVRTRRRAGQITSRRRTAPALPYTAEQAQCLWSPRWP